MLILLLLALNFKTTFIRYSSGGFKFDQKCTCSRNVPTRKFTHSLLHLQPAENSVSQCGLIQANILSCEQTLRRLSLGVRAGDSNLAKSVIAIEMYQHKDSHTACYTCKLPKKSLILAYLRSLHVRKMKPFCG